MSDGGFEKSQCTASILDLPGSLAFTSPPRPSCASMTASGLRVGDRASVASDISPSRPRLPHSWRLHSSPGRFYDRAPLIGFSKDRPSITHTPKKPACPSPLRMTSARRSQRRARSAFVVPPHHDGLAPRALHRLVASCSRSWGSPGFHSAVPPADDRSPSFPTDATPSRVFPSYGAVPRVTAGHYPRVVHQLRAGSTSRSCSPWESVAPHSRCQLYDARYSRGLPFLELCVVVVKP